MKFWKLENIIGKRRKRSTHSFQLKINHRAAWEKYLWAVEDPNLFQVEIKNEQGVDRVCLRKI